jgi:hypothetical protein
MFKTAKQLKKLIDEELSRNNISRYIYNSISTLLKADTPTPAQLNKLYEAETYFKILSKISVNNLKLKAYKDFIQYINDYNRQGQEQAEAGNNEIFRAVAQLKNDVVSVLGLDEGFKNETVEKLEEAEDLILSDTQLFKKTLKRLKESKSFTKININHFNVKIRNVDLSKGRTLDALDYKLLTAFHLNLKDNALKCRLALIEENNRILPDYISLRIIKLSVDVLKNEITNIYTGDEINISVNGDGIETIDRELNSNLAVNSNITFFNVGYGFLWTNRAYRGFETKNLPLTLRKLRAFSPSDNADFHNLTVKSTTDNKICIYETFININNINNMFEKYNSKENRQLFKNQLKAEGEEIEKAVKNGELINSIELLNKKYNVVSYIMFYDDINTERRDNIIKIDETGNITDENIRLLPDDTLLFLYDEKNQHVAPTKKNKIKIKVIEIDGENLEIEKPEAQFILRPEYLNISKDILPKYKKLTTNEPKKVLTNKQKGKIQKELIKKSKETIKGETEDIKICLAREEAKLKMQLSNVLVYDIETFNNNENVAVPFLICVYGLLGGEKIEKSFYGINSINDFVDYLDEISSNNKLSKTHATTKTEKILLYGFNNSRFDNMLIWKELFFRNKTAQPFINNNAIKSITYNNVKILDLSLIFSGSLQANCISLKISNEGQYKGVFPYKFVNSENLNYNGLFPAYKYFEKISIEDYENEKKICGDKFDMKDYSIKYCLQDVILTYKLALSHLNQTVGIINNRVFNVMNCGTISGASLKIFNQCFNTDNIKGSPDHILTKEKISYHGGRTEIFKKSFTSTEEKPNLYYHDRNSSYPASMTEMMPFQYIETRQLNNVINKLNVSCITKTNLYGVKSYKYIGNNEYVINNLVELNEKGGLMSYSNSKTEENYIWGCEIIEAVNNDFEISLFEVNKYEAKDILKEFSNYFYEERLKAKKEGNTTKTAFYKLILNSLYGKFGQRVFSKIKICNTTDDFFNILDNDNNIIKNINPLDDDNYMIVYNNKFSGIKSIGNLTRFSSYISALSRTNLFVVMKDIGFNNIYYCDTDSIFSDVQPSKKFLDNKKLGWWKDETNGINIKQACFISPKTYYYEKHNGEIDKKAKGIKGDNLKFDDYISLLSGEKVEQENTTFFRSLNKVVIKPQNRTIKAVLTKRTFTGNDSHILE